MMQYTLVHSDVLVPEVITLVGCGGTGAFVAEGMCRLLGGTRRRLMLVDPDVVEPHNIRRQAFYESDIGRPKARVLAERLARNYGQAISYVVSGYEKEFWHGGLLVSCVDNFKARRAIHKTITHSWWIDVGNGESSGQVLIGNGRGREALQGAFIPSRGQCLRLPTPTMQCPALLEPDALAARAAVAGDCAEAVGAGVQGPVINQWMAALCLEFVSRLLTGRLTWMAAYLDVDVGSLRAVEATPENVAKLLGRMRVRDLIVREERLKTRRKPQEACLAEV